MSEPVIDYNFILDNSSPDSIISALSQVIGVLIDSKAEQSVGGIDIGVGSDGWIRIRSDLQLKRRVAPKQDESSDTTKQYARRNPMVLDKAGGYYVRHVMAMTREGLHAKSHIAAELAWRDAEIDRLKEALSMGEEPLHEMTDPENIASSDYQLGFRHGYNRRDAEVLGALA